MEKKQTMNLSLSDIFNKILNLIIFQLLILEYFKKDESDKSK